MDEFIRDLQEVDTPTVANAVEFLEIRDRTVGYSDYRLRCMFPQLGTMVGHAVTAKVDSTTAGAPSSDREPVFRFFELLEDSPKPSVMVFQEAGAQPERGCHCGDVMAAIGKRLGCVGIVSDSGVRDADGVLALGLHYFAAGYVASHGNFRIEAVGVPITVAGLEVEPGDLLHGDISGLVNVPPELRGPHTELVAQIRSSESATVDVVNSPSFNVQRLRESW